MIIKNRKENFDLVELNLLEDKLKTKDKILISKKKKEINEDELNIDEDDENSEDESKD